MSRMKRMVLILINQPPKYRNRHVYANE